MLLLRRPSQLASASLAGRILDITGGTIGEFSMLVNAAAVHSIKTGSEQITAEALESCGDIPPSKRKQIAASL